MKLYKPEFPHVAHIRPRWYRVRSHCTCPHKILRRIRDNAHFNCKQIPVMASWLCSYSYYLECGANGHTDTYYFTRLASYADTSIRPDRAYSPLIHVITCCATGRFACSAHWNSTEPHWRVHLHFRRALAHICVELGHVRYCVCIQQTQEHSKIH